MRNCSTQEKNCKGKKKVVQDWNFCVIFLGQNNNRNYWWLLLRAIME
jgi:hypothetical protein